MTEYNAVLGQYLRDYKPPRFVVNRSINDLFAPANVRAFPPSAIITTQKRVPDVSFYQGVINWIQMRTQTDAAIIRAGQHLNADSQFAINWSRAKAQGMARGLYWFYDDRADPGRQAALLASLVQNDLPEMEIWIDYEVVYGGAFGGLGNVVAMMQRVEQLLPTVTVGIYTGYYFFRDHSNAVTNASQYNYLRSRPLWLAWYTSNPANVLIPAPWTSLLFWQFGTPAIGAQYGVQSAEIDLNYFNGSQADFDFRYAGELPMPTVTYWKVTNPPGSWLRAGPGEDYARVGELWAPFGSILPAMNRHVNNPGIDEWLEFAPNQWYAAIRFGQPRVEAVTLGGSPETLTIGFDALSIVYGGETYSGAVVDAVLRKQA